MLKSLDVFSSYFQVTIKQQKTLKTNCGGFITVIIVGTGLLYLISMINNYNNGNYLPKVINWDI